MTTRIDRPILTVAFSLLLLALAHPCLGSFEIEGKVLMVVGEHGVAVVDPWRRTQLRKWSKREVRQPAFSPDARWMTEVDREGRNLRVVDLEDHERDKEVLSNSEFSPIGALFGEDASKLWVVSGATKSLLEMAAPGWRVGRILPLQGPEPSRFWRCGSRGFIFQSRLPDASDQGAKRELPAVLTEVDLQKGQILGAVNLPGCSACLTDPAGDTILTVSGSEWGLLNFGQKEASWKAMAKAEQTSHVCLLPVSGGAPQVVALDATGGQVTAYQADTVRLPPETRAEPGALPLDAYVPGETPRIQPTPAPLSVPRAQLRELWRVVLPGNYSCLVASPDGNTLFLGQESPRELLVLSIKSHQIIARLPLPLAPRLLAWP